MVVKAINVPTSFRSRVRFFFNEIKGVCGLYFYFYSRLYRKITQSIPNTIHSHIRTYRYTLGGLSTDGAMCTVYCVWRENGWMAKWNNFPHKHTFSLHQYVYCSCIRIKIRKEEKKNGSKCYVILMLVWCYGVITICCTSLYLLEFSFLPLGREIHCFIILVKDFGLLNSCTYENENWKSKIDHILIVLEIRKFSRIFLNNCSGFWRGCEIIVYREIGVMILFENMSSLLFLQFERS